MSIRAMFWDMSEVFISGYFGSEETVATYSNIKSDDFLRARLRHNDWYKELMRDNIVEDAYFAKLVSELKCDLKLSELRDLVLMHLCTPVPGTFELFQEIKSAKGYQMVLISDYVRSWTETVNRRTKLLQEFDRTFFSYDMRALKNDGPGLFERVLRETNLGPKEVVFIDDLEFNITTAEKAGIDSILFTDAASLREELVARQIL